MDSSFSKIVFDEPARAESNLAAVARLLPKKLWTTLPALLAQLPDPGGALNYLERFLSERTAQESSPQRALEYMKRHPAALHHLLVVFSYSRFLAEMLVQEPELLVWLHRPYGAGGQLEQLKSKEEFHAEFARFQKAAQDLPPRGLLARFKRREYLRIMLRDVLGIATLTGVTLELSHLADVLLDRALYFAEQKLEGTFGQPQFTDSAGIRQVTRLSILSLGKLGGEELNYSSDVDLMFLYGQDGETSGGSEGATTNLEYFIRVAQAVLKIVTEATAEGSLFRVDLRLRPQGSEGDLVISIPAALNYYRTRAHEWELQALVKARCSAGDVASGRAFLREVQPLVYRPEFNLGAVQAVLDAREGITRSLRERAGATGHAAEWNVKLSPGGIRDIEFLAQSLQRVYGGADRWLRSGATLVALQRLHDKGHISGRDFFRLAAAYQFLRKVEHRLQLRNGLQRHTLPASPDALERLARRCGVEPAPAGGPSAGAQLLRRIEQHLTDVRGIYDRTLALHPPAAPAPESPADVQPGSLALMRRQLADFPQVAGAFSEHIEDALSRRGLLRFLGAAVLDRSVMARLEENPEWIARAAEIFARSDLAVEMLSRNPEEVSLLAAAAAGSLESLFRPREREAPPEAALAAVRTGYRRAVLGVLARALLGASQPFDTFETLTRLAEQAIGETLAIAARETSGLAEVSHAPFVVLALGRLATREMDLGSDVDLVFVVENQLEGEGREPWRRIVERFVLVASSYTREGLLFAVDTRLRPHGVEGEILQSVSSLTNYFTNEAEAWEAAAFLKARPIAGNLELGEEVLRALHAAAAERFSDRRQLAERLVHTRTLMERSAVVFPRGGEPALAGNKGSLKVLPGGFYDIEYVLAWLFLTQNLEPSPSALGHVLRQIAQLESSGALDSSAAQALRSAALLYRSLDHAVRLITGRPAVNLPEPGLEPRVRQLLDLWHVPVSGSLEQAVESVRQSCRALYDRFIVSATT